MKYKSVIACSAAALTAALFGLGLAACNKTKAPEAAALPPAVPQEARSPAAAAIASHLEYGGQFFAVVDIKGDLEKFGSQMADMLGALAKAPGGDGIPPLNYGPIFQRLGLYGIEGGGMSSWQANNDVLFHNRGFLYVPGGRQGLLKVVGGAPVSFLAPTLAPADADFVAEGTIDLKALADLILGLIRDVAGPDQLTEVMGILRQPVAPDTTVTWQMVLNHLDTRVTIIGRADPKATLQVDTGFNIPQLDLLIALDGFADLYTQLEPAIKESPLFELTDKNGMRVATWAFPIDPPYNIYKPTLIADPASKRLYLVSRLPFADSTIFGQGTRLASAKDYQAATVGFPKAGNALTYVSHNALSLGIATYQKILAQMPSASAMPNNSAIDDLTKAPHGLASVQVNQPDGIFLQSVNTSSGKSVFMLAPAFATGVMAAMAVPAFSKVRDQSREKAVTNNLRQIATSAQQYMLEKGVTQVRYQDIVGTTPDKYLRPITPVMGERYDNLIIRSTDTEISVRTPDGQVVTFKM